MGQDEAIAQYLASARVRNFTPGTIRSKRREIVRFRAWLHEEQRESSLTAIDDTTARDYRRHLASQNVARMTWAPHLGTIKHFFAWAARNDLVLADPFERVEVPRRQKTLPPYLTQPEVKAILDATPSNELLCDRAILEVLYSSALRIRELTGLDLADIDLAQRVILIRQGKGRKDRVVPVGRIAATLTGRYIRETRVAAPSQRRALFLTHDGRRLTEAHVRTYILRPALVRAGVQKHVTLHVFRHSCAIHMLENGASVREIQVLLGHAKLATTQKYLNVIPLELKKAHARAHPAEHQATPAEATPSRIAPSKWDTLRRPGGEE